MVIVAGFGFRAAATRASFADALTQTGRMDEVTHVSAPEDKVSASEFTAFAAHRPVTGVDPVKLTQQMTLTQSEVSMTARGTGSVAEAAALAAAGQNAKIIVPRVISTDRLATCALAIGDGP